MNYLIGLLCLSFALATNATETNTAKNLDFKILAERSHKPTLFTQGLLLQDGYFFESSGLYNKSLLVSYPISEPQNTWAKLTAPFTQKQNIPSQYFAEGLTLLNDKLYLLTWQEGILFVYDVKHFNLLSTHYYQGEGWGLATDGQYLIRSDGSDVLYFHKPDDFRLVKKLKVTLNQKSVTSLNELEYVDGFIYANIWHDNHILKIDAKTGITVGVLDLSQLTSSLHLEDSESVLNGIAYDSNKKAFWITGKQWPKMFLVQLLSPNLRK